MRIFEGGQVASSEATLGEYVKALVAVDRLDTPSLIRTLQVGPCIFKYVTVISSSVECAEILICGDQCASCQLPFTDPVV